MLDWNLLLGIQPYIGRYLDVSYIFSSLSGTGSLKSICPEVWQANMWNQVEELFGFSVGTDVVRYSLTKRLGIITFQYDEITNTSYISENHVGTWITITFRTVYKGHSKTQIDKTILELRKCCLSRTRFIIVSISTLRGTLLNISNCFY